MNIQRDSELLSRAEKILKENIYPTSGFPWSPYRCISPAMGKFKGVWNWDTAFHSVGISRFDTKIAKEGIYGFFQFQKDNGLLPDVIFEDGRVVDTFSKPPVFPWSIETVYKRDGDLKFLEDLYPKLVLNENWWVQNRSLKGLFHYDAGNPDYDDYITRVRYESGWDNSVRWDKGIKEYWAIDLNCFMVMFYRSMSFIAKELKISEDAEKWIKKADTLSELINKKLWNDTIKSYVDVNRFTGEYSEVLTPASFMPLYIRIATEARAQAMAKIAEVNFRSKMPSVSFDNPEFSTDYWRGPTWLNIAYFAAKGLKNYDFPVADKIKENILDMCYKNKDGIYENYNSATDEGQRYDNFSWSCVFIAEFILNF